jgi:hypothetical protein
MSSELELGDMPARVAHGISQPAPPARHAFPTSSQPPLAGRLAEVGLAPVNIRSKLRRFGQVAATTTSAIAQEPWSMNSAF